MKGELLEAERVHSIVGAFFTVCNYYGYGLSEAIYAGALEYELIDRGHEVVRELLVAVSYQGRHVGWQRLDMIVDSAVIVENKATEKLSPVARPQLISYLRATPFQVGVLLHFGPHPTFYRFIDFPKRAQSDSCSFVQFVSPSVGVHLGRSDLTLDTSLNFRTVALSGTVSALCGYNLQRLTR